MASDPSSTAKAARPIPVVRTLDVGQRPTADVNEQPTVGTMQWIYSAPPWLLSLIFHLAVVIIVGVWGVWRVIASAATQFVPIDVAPPEETRYAEKLGDQLHDEAGLGGPDVDPHATEQIISYSDLPEVDNPLAAPPMTADVSETGTALASNIDAPNIGLALSGREAGRKHVLLGAYGGNATTESSVEKGLGWLLKNQQSSGLWSLAGPYSDGTSQGDNVDAASAMALLALQGAGHTHVKGKHAKPVAKAWSALVARQEADGRFGRGVASHAALYTHAQCMIALCELFGMSGDSRYRPAAQKAVDFAVKSQAPEGGWRYEPGRDSDTSVTGWFAMGLHSARMAGLTVPETTFTGIGRYLDSAQQAGGREYLYQVDSFGSPAMTAEGLLCRQYLGWKQTDPRLVDGVSALLGSAVNYSSPDRDVYYWYYATQACHHMENPIVNGERRFIWKEWNKVMRQEIPSHQIKQGPEAGSWDPQGDKWGDSGGRLYVTCLSIYMLEVYYRHLPIYSAEKFMVPR